ncbi:hypothetical protein [Flavobacterium luteum]|uniref:Uncharacterized protein n=1 Tax=Flavobacterium luteum TaxID=2026654 RepID=A0A7J5AD35_9FLAO|nr:hypothetical protein [Flavobacterium luteum]KAB1155491.1 hypothetical protein F6464_10260 [Flavobacterium luteum]
MKEIILTFRQQMLPPDIFAYEFGLFPRPEKIENTKIATYILIGVLVTITLGLISYRVYQIHQENKSKKLN